MSDVLRSVTKPEARKDAKKADTSRATPTPQKDPILRRSSDPETPKTIERADVTKVSANDANRDADKIERPVPLASAAPALASPAMAAPAARPPISRLGIEPEPDVPGRGLVWIAAILALITALGMGAWIYGYFDLSQSGQTIGPWGFLALTLAVVVPAALILMIGFAIRAFRLAQHRAEHLSRIADRLTRADETAARDIQTMASAIRSEMAAVDARMAQSRTQLEGLMAQLSQKSSAMDETSATMSQRSEEIGRNITLQRQAIESITSTFDSQMASLTTSLQTQRDKLSQTSEDLRTQTEGTTQAVSGAADNLKSAIDHLQTANQSGGKAVEEAEARLHAAAEKVAAQSAELDQVYARQSDHLSFVADRLSAEDTATSKALQSQTDRLAAIDAQIEITERKLGKLLDHVTDIQDRLQTRFDAIGTTFTDAEDRAKTYSETLTTRVSDSVAEARRELSTMEAELRALQTRMDNTQEGLPLNEPEQGNRRPGRIHLQPLDTDFPPVEAPRPTPSRRDRRAEDDFELTASDTADAAQATDLEASDDPLNLTAAIEIPVGSDGAEPGDDVIRRTTDETGFGRRRRPGGRRSSDKPRSSWHWRDMLGGLEPAHAEDEMAGPSMAAPQPPAPTPPLPTSPALDRPPAGVPLTAPPPKPAAAAALPDGSDVVARLCEVQLAPSAIVDDGTIFDATRARMTGGEASQVDLTLARIREPVVHLRGVLAADLEFKLRAESFARNSAAHLSTIKDEADARAWMGTASGRAYMLVAAALRS